MSAPPGALTSAFAAAAITGSPPVPITHLPMRAGETPGVIVKADPATSRLTCFVDTNGDATREVWDRLLPVTDQRVRSAVDRLAAGVVLQMKALCPVSPVEAWPLGQLGPARIGGQPAGPRGHAAFTPLFNYGSVPAIRRDARLAA